jgi:DNA polymerase-3 subunit delta'
MTLDDAKGYLRGAFEAERMAHAYVVEGTLREEASQLALWLASLLLCEGGRDAAPCGACTSCRRVAEHSHPDLGWEEPQKKSRILSVDQMRQLQRRAFQTSFSGGWKVCVIAGADCMNIASANAFLKTLEEPPDRTLFLLLTDRPQALLPTIISRCQRLVLASLTDELDEARRAQLVGILSRPVGGVVTRLGRAHLILGLLEEVKAQVASEIKAEASDDDTVTSETEEARISSVYRERRTAIIRSLQFWYRDILLLVCGASAAHLVFPEAEAVLRELAQSRLHAAALRDVATIDTIDERLSARNMSEQTVLEQALLTLS